MRTNLFFTIASGNMMYNLTLALNNDPNGKYLYAFLCVAGVILAGLAIEILKDDDKKEEEG